MTGRGATWQGLWTALWAVVVVVTLVSTLLLLLGWRPVVLLSDSMQPTAPAGSMVLSRPVDAAEVAVGDIITVPRGKGRPVTHRVIAVERAGDVVLARLQGDANDEPDLGRVELTDDVLRAFAIVPFAGRVVGSGAPLFLVGLLVLGAGLRGLQRTWRERPGPATPATDDAHAPAPAATDHPPRAASAPEVADARVVALVASLEAFQDDGLPSPVTTTLARVRLGELLGGGRVEAHPTAHELDDGARFVLFSLVDADVDALRLVPAGSARQRAARRVVDTWWSELAPIVTARLDDDARALVEPGE